MSYLLFDLESKPDPNMLPAAPRHPYDCAHASGGCPACGAPPVDVFSPPLFHEVVCIGYMKLSKSFEVEELDVLTGDERTMLETLTRHLDAARPVLVGWNSRTFDVPVVDARCFLHGIPFPWLHGPAPRGADPRYRYSTGAHYDVMDYASGYGASAKLRLDYAAKAMGLPGKVGVDGSMVAGMLERGEIEKVADYCAADVAQLAGVLLRVELVRGRLDLDGYRRAMLSLIGEIVRSPRLGAIRHGGMDYDKLMLEKLGDKAYIATPANGGPATIENKGACSHHRRDPKGDWCVSCGTWVSDRWSDAELARLESAAQALADDVRRESAKGDCQ